MARFSTTSRQIVFLLTWMIGIVTLAFHAAPALASGGSSSSLSSSSSREISDPDAQFYRRRDREDTFGDTSKEQILATRERRKRQLKNMVDGARRKLADHSMGEIELSADEKKQLEDQMDIFQRKLDTMKEELEDWEIERLIAREQKRAQIRKERSETTRRVGREEM